jgi:hypothetical protein
VIVCDEPRTCIGHCDQHDRGKRTIDQRWSRLTLIVPISPRHWLDRPRWSWTDCCD